MNLGQALVNHMGINNKNSNISLSQLKRSSDSITKIGYSTSLPTKNQLETKLFGTSIKINKYKKLKYRNKIKPGTNLDSREPAKQWGGYGGSGTSGSWESRKPKIGNFLSQKTLANFAASSTISAICLFGTLGA